MCAKTHLIDVVHPLSMCILRNLSVPQELSCEHRDVPYQSEPEAMKKVGNQNRRLRSQKSGRIWKVFRGFSWRCWQLQRFLLTYPKGQNTNAPKTQGVHRLEVEGRMWLEPIVRLFLLNWHRCICHSIKFEHFRRVPHKGLNKSIVQGMSQDQAH